MAMGVISFSDKPENIWCVAGWAFRQVLEDVASCHPRDSEMAKEFFVAETQSGLHIDLLDSPLSARVTNAIRRVAEGILSGEIRSGILDKSYGDAETVEQYREGLRQLLEVIPQI
jgi:hypothetical protein